MAGGKPQEQNHHRPYCLLGRIRTLNHFPVFKSQPEIRASAMLGRRFFTGAVQFPQIPNVSGKQVGFPNPTLCGMAVMCRIRVSDRRFFSLTVLTKISSRTAKRQASRCGLIRRPAMIGLHFQTALLQLSNKASSVTFSPRVFSNISSKSRTPMPWRFSPDTSSTTCP